MDQNFQTSFIPKKPLVKERAVASQPVSLFTIIPIILIFVVGIVAVGLYLYEGSLTQKIAKMENDLNLARNRFEDNKITQLQVLDKRLRASNQVLSSHIAVSPIFQALQDTTLKTVRYTRFDYSISEGAIPEIKISMAGQATNYKSIALQSEIFAKKKVFIDPVFSNLSLDEKGNVLFDLTFNVDSSFVNYNKSLAGGSADSDISQIPEEVQN